MHVVVPKEDRPYETRIALICDHVARLTDMGIKVSIEKGLGEALHMRDECYANVGAKIVSNRQSLLQSADMVLHLHKPKLEEISLLKPGCIYLSHLDPFHEKNLVEKFRRKNITSVSLEMVPRTTRAQKMDVLSSQANLAGYVAVVMAAERLNQILPMMMTPAGTIKPAHVFIIGAGVAGLQAIAQAKRMGAQVQAFDTRPVVEEEVKSLGAKFVKVDLGETGQTKDGYAKKLTQAQLHKQRQKMAQVCAASDIIITTAKLFGRKAPLIITKEMIKGMKPGSVIVDLAVETGGNVEGSVLNKEVDVNGVHIIGIANLPGRVAVDASQMYSSNLVYFIQEYWDTENRTFRLDLEDEILKACVITHNGEIVNETIKKHYQKNT